MSEPTPRGAAIYALKMQRLANESQIQERLVKALEVRGITCEQRVRTACGIADVVTEDTVYEVKVTLTHDVLFKAFGQVVLYAAALGKSRRVLIGHEVATTEAMCEVIRAQGVEINVVP